MGIKISNIYGTDSTWLTLRDNTATLATLSQDYTSRPYFNHAIGAGLANGTLDVLNTSICPIAVDNGASIAGGQYVMLKPDDTLYIYNVEPDQTPIMFINSPRGDGNCTIYLDHISTDANTKSSYWDSGFVLSSPYGSPSPYPGVMTSFSQPIVQFGYKNYLLAITVCASTNNTAYGNYYFADLATYCKYDYKQYPYVNSVQLAVYESTGNTRGYNNIGYNLGFDSDTFRQTGNQQILNFFSYLPIGNVNRFVDYDGVQYTAYKSSNYFNRRYVYYDDTRRSELGGTIAIGGLLSLDGGRYTRQLQAQRAIYIPNADNMFTIGWSADEPNLLYTYHQVTDINVFREWCLKQTAYFGMYFTESIYDLGALTPDTLTTRDTTYMGIIDKSGITHGEYVQGKDIKNYDQSEWDSLKNQSPYDHTKRPDPSAYDDETKLNTDRLFTVGSNVFTNMYALSRMTTYDLRQYLYSVVAPESTSETNTKQFLTNNPIDCIVGCYQYPFDVVPKIAHSETIRLGNTNAKSTTGIELSGFAVTDCLRVLDFGQVEYYPFFGDFRDFEPYSEALLYIPYVGYIPLSPAEFMGTQDTPVYIGVKMIVDLSTGACTALIYRNNLVIQTANGTIGLQIPITGVQQADFANAIHNAEYQTKLAMATTIGSLATSTVSGIATAMSGNGIGTLGALTSMSSTVATGVLTTEQMQYNLQHTKVPFKVSGSASPACDFDNEQFCRLILKRPVMDSGYNKDVYGHTVGFACCINGRLANFTGLTVCSNAVFTTNATSAERKMIIDNLQSGVYI